MLVATKRSMVVTYHEGFPPKTIPWFFKHTVRQGGDVLRGSNPESHLIF